MKLDVAVNEVTLSNVGTTGEFKIRNSAKAFKILSDGLYSNKIRAIIRELSCNAVDSHVAAGKSDVPFEVHLPTVLEPWFAVRDFGIGLDGDQVVNIYTTYFESTKTDSNDFIGALGLGSKSPFSYTENFTVTAIKGGTKRIYSAFINEHGIPCVAEMAAELTDEINGVEVKFSVTDKGDYYSFQNQAAYVFEWFKNKPTITGVVSFEHRTTHFKDKDIVPGVHYVDTRSSIAIMGNISYPINISEPTKHLGNLAALLDCGLVMEFAIGELDFAASREELSYIPLTINSIKRKLTELNANLAAHLKVKADAIESEWKRAIYLYEESSSRLYAAAVLKYVADTKFELFDTKQYHGRKTFDYPIEDFAARGLAYNGFEKMHHKCSSFGERTEYVGSNYVKMYRFPVQENVIIVLNDLKTGAVSRARFHYSSEEGRQTVIVMSHKDPDVAVRQVEYDKLIKELHNPPVVVLASTLRKRERAIPVSNSGITLLTKQPGHRRNNHTPYYQWVPHPEAIDEDETYYYIALNNTTPIDDKGAELPMSQVKEWMSNCGIPEISSLKMYGVRKSRIKEMKEYENWVNIEDKLKEETAKVDSALITKMISAEMVDTYNNRHYTNETVARLAGPQSLYSLYCKKYGGLTKTTTVDVTSLLRLSERYGKVVEVDAVKKSINADRAALVRKYPLLPDIAGAKADKIAEYILMVDKLYTLEKN
jgi:hypothetical protein